jgi:hypothetical protein
VIAHIHVRSIHGVQLPHKNLGHKGGYATNGNIGGIHEEPLAVLVIHTGEKGRHELLLKGLAGVFLGQQMLNRRTCHSLAGHASCHPHEEPKLHESGVYVKEFFRALAAI